ncbi:hypothetical protein IGI04_039514 [Brassica rapa subsp. trilocularis]|uniref:Replication protein A 70 kDa DNA-binding subunit B/D first OB fold domain-containing protein n=1 Tax=Brassica rapa subsp. trilocularis TaxID=1813537 RepID=A0ABQ7KK31_BRACM|nr:hypothetical protein IGI04_039514 [Brassica rapa subsp. trilocularis]
MAAITAVCDLKPFKSIWKIRVKIICLWKQYSASGGVTIEMVLIDSNVVNYRDILDGTHNTDYLVAKCNRSNFRSAPIEVVSADGKDTKKITVELRNEKDECLPMVLWGNFATDVSEAIERCSDNAIVCVLRLPKDEPPFAVVQPKPLMLTNGVGDKK